MKIFVASLCSSLIQCPTPRYDATLKNVQDYKTVLITSDVFWTIIYTIYLFLLYPSHYDLYLAILGLDHWIIDLMHTVLIVLSR